MREPLPESERQKDLDALITLPEFFKEPIPAYMVHYHLEKEKGNFFDTISKTKRDRSSSAPPLAWLRSTSSRGSLTASSLGRSDSLKGKSKCLQMGGEVFLLLGLCYRVKNVRRRV